MGNIGTRIKVIYLEPLSAPEEVLIKEPKIDTRPSRIMVDGSIMPGGVDETNLERAAGRLLDSETPSL